MTSPQAIAAARVTEAQRHALEFAETATSKGWEGVCPRRGQHVMFANLALRGLLADIGWGVDADDRSRDVRLYAITDAGRAAIRAAKGAP